MREPAGRAGGAGRRRRRPLLVAALVLAVVAVAAVVALPGLDRRARQGAAAAVAGQLQRELGLAEPPEVTIGGRWFLPQALAGRYGEGTVSTPALSQQGATVRDVRVLLRDVRVPLGVVLGRGGAIDVGSGSARALVPWAEVEARATASAGRPVSLAAEGEDVRATTTVTVLRRELDLALTATPQLGERSLRLRPRRVSLDGREVDLDDVRSVLGRPLPAPFDRLGPSPLDQVGGLLDGVDVDLAQVPPEVQLREARVLPDGVAVRADLSPLSFPVAAG